jgi:hypothetical protein
MHRNMAQYREHFRALQTPPKPGTLVINTNPFRNFKIEVYEQNNAMSHECADGLDKAATMQPADPPLDDIAKVYAATLRRLIPLMNEADVYYDQKDHIDDKLAKGRKLDAQLAPEFAALEKASADMRAAVDDRDAQLKAARLTTLEAKEGRSLDWHTLNVMIVARKAVKDLQAAPLSKATVATHETSMQQAFDAARAAADAAPAAPAGKRPLWSGLQSNASNLLVAIKDLRRDLDAGKRASIDPVLARYDDLVRNHNLMAGVR